MKGRSGFEKLIDIKEKKLDLKKGEMARVVAARETLKTSVRLLRERLEGLTVRSGEVVEPGELFLRSGGGEYIVHQIEIKEKEIEKLGLEEEEKRGEILVLHREMKGYQRIHRERLKQLERELQKKQEREVDDIFSTRTSAP